MRADAAREKEKWKGRGLAVFFVLALWLVLGLAYDFYYDLNDDMTMRDIVCGAYTGTPDGHNIQSLYPLGFLLSLLYRLMPGLAWYAFFLCGCQFLALYISLRALTANLRETWKQATALFLVTAAIGLLFLYEFVFVQYTVTVGLLMCAALLRICRGPAPGEAGFYTYHSLTVGLVVLAFYLRTEMMLLLCPFLALAALWRGGRLWRERAQRQQGQRERTLSSIAAWCKGYGVLAAVTGLFMAVGILADSAAYGSVQWKEFRQFFDDRTRVYDFYGIPAYEENKAFYDSLGLSRAEYALLENYNFDLDEAIDADMMRQIAAYAASHQDESPARRLYESVYTYGYRFAHGQELIFDLLLFFSYFFLIKAGIRRKDRGLLLHVGLVFGLRTALWIFLLYRGRVPERITHPLYLVELALLGVLFVEDAHVFQWKKYEKSAILFLYVMLLVCGAASHVGDVGEEYARRQEAGLKWQAWRDYCRERPDQFYLLDVYSSVAYSEKMFVDTSPAYRNFDLPGGWCVKSPLAAQKRRVAGLGDAQGALLAGEAFFVSDNTRQERSPEFLIPYYKEKGETVTVREVDRCGCFSVYQIDR